MDEITKYQTVSIIRNMDDAERAARAMAQSGFFQDSKQASQAVVKILAGQELGFGPFASMTGVHIIQNKPVLAANLMAAAVKRTEKYNYKILRLDDTGCELEFYENGQAVGKSAFTQDDARKAGLLEKDTWRKYPRNLYFARALSNGQKWYAPDVFKGATVYTPEEMGADVDEEGNAVITAEAKPEPKADTVSAKPPQDAKLDEVDKMFPPAQPTKVQYDKTQMANCLDANTVKLMVKLKLSENDIASARALAKFKPQKAPLGKLVEKMQSYRDLKDNKIETEDAIERVNKVV